MPVKMAMYKIIAVRENAFLSIFTKNWSCKQKFTSRSHNIEEVFGCPEKPKQPVNSFLRFFINYKSDYAAQNRTNKPTEIVRIMSKAWKEMPEKEREKYIEEYNNEKLKYKEKLEAYQKALTQTQKEDIIKLKEKIKNTIIKGSHYSKEELEVSLKKPIHPTPPFPQFYKDSKGSDKSNIKVAAEQWKNLPESEKKKYLHEYKKEKEKYIESLKNWEIKMIKEGNIDALSTKTLKELAHKF